MDFHKNWLLASLPPADLEMLAPHLREVDLPRRTGLFRSHRQISDVYFLTSGIASTVANPKETAAVEIGLTGREGFVGIAVLLGAGQSINECYMQVGGAGFSIAAATFVSITENRAFQANPLLRYVHVFMSQIVSTAHANAKASIGERLARWILMAHDRIEADGVPLTHEFLAVMLGVRRAGVTSASRDLEQRGLIARHRGLIEVIDRPGLEAMAGVFYGQAEQEYRRLLGVFPRG